MSSFCTNCGNPLEDDEKFCVKCGNKKEEISLQNDSDEQSNFCTSCGTKLPKDSIFCVNCGKKLEEPQNVTLPSQINQQNQQPVIQQQPVPAPPATVPHIQKQITPSHPKSNKLKIAGAIIIVAMLLLTVFYVGFQVGKQKNENENEDAFGETPGKINILTNDLTTAGSGSVDNAGGSVGITNTNSPLNGLNIEVPEGATPETIDFSFSYADVTNISGLPEDTSIASWLIKIGTGGSSSWNNYKTFDKPCNVTLPYNPDIITNEESIRFYYYDEEDNRLDSTGFISQDMIENTITFYTGTFSSFIAIELSIAVNELFEEDYTVDSGFRPSTDGWFITNFGSYISAGGNCLGMTGFAKWYYAHKKADAETSLYNKYIDGDPKEWRDDETAIQLASRCQLGTSGIWSSLTQEEKDWAKTNARDVAYSIIHGLKVSGEPQLVGLATRFNNGTWAEGGHAVLAYSYTGGTFEIYDPNYPKTAPGTDARQIPFTYNTGFTRVYSSGQNAGEGRQYNIFYHAGIKTFAPLNAYSGLYDSAEKDFTDDSIFPTVTLTDANSMTLGETPIDTDGDGIRDTTESKVTISGIITEGQEEVTSTLIFVSNRKFQVPVNAGSFSQEVPLFAGDNDIVVLTTEANTWENWAGYLSDTIRSSASTSSLTFTLTWEQDNCDIDLHVLEPTIDEEKGRHIYYGNKGSSIDEHPYLDIDNTWGYGPEHYYATDQMTLPNYQESGKSIYGMYKFRTNYYSDAEDDPYGNPPIPTKPVNWNVHVRYLAYKDPNDGTEYWEESLWNGILRDYIGWGDPSNFESTDSSWSPIYELYYDQPNPEDYGVPPPPQNQIE